MSKMVERVQEVLLKSLAAQGLLMITPQFAVVPHGRDIVIDCASLARAAIEAMREPTTEMLDAACAAKKKHNEEWPGGTENEPCARDPSGEDYWHAMIDAALRE